jgi:hypothetical protein
MAPSETKIVPGATSEATALTNVVALPQRPEPTTPSERALSFIKEHPVLTVAGGVAVGLAISALIPRSFSRKFATRAFRAAEAGAAAALSFGGDVLDKGEDGSALARKKAKVLAGQAGKLGNKAATRAEKLSEKAFARAEKLSDRAVARAERLGVAMLGTAGTWGHVAADRADKLGQAAAIRAEVLGERTSDRLSQFGDKALVTSTKLLGYPKRPATFADRLLDKAHDLRARVRG